MTGATTGDASACCLCLLQTGTDGTSITIDPSSTDALDTNCVQGSAPFNDENVQCSTDASGQVVEGESAGPVMIEAESCVDLCADDCGIFTLSTT